MKPKGDLLWSLAAQQDLQDIWKYFARLASYEVANKLLSDIEAAAYRILDNPQGWRERTDLRPNIRSVPVHPYTVFYRLNGKLPEIVRVLHERRNAARILTTEPAEER
jgi:toxin ParE1/3/4